MKIKKAPGLTGAGKSELRFEPYQKGKRLSSLKLQIGELLLFLQLPLTDEKIQKGWSLFEVLLRQYWEDKA